MAGFRPSMSKPHCWITLPASAASADWTTCNVLKTRVITAIVITLFGLSAVFLMSPIALPPLLRPCCSLWVAGKVLAWPASKA
jgi:hypothetical protein